MSKRYRHPDLGYFHKLDLTEGVIATAFVSDTELTGLVKYLNEAEVRHHGDRIMRIVQEMLGLEKVEKPLWGGTKEEDAFSSGPNARPMTVMRHGRSVINPLLRRISPVKYRCQKEIERRELLLNRELARFHFVPYTWSPLKGQWCVVWRTLSPTLRKRRAAGQAMILDDGPALQMILDLARAGYINRLRRCSDCRKWLFAKFRHQSFCSTACQQKHYRDSDEWRRHRREYMRRYRQFFAEPEGQKVAERRTRK